MHVREPRCNFATLKPLRDRQAQLKLSSNRALVLVRGLCFKQHHVNILDSSKRLKSPPIAFEPRQPRQPRLAASGVALDILGPCLDVFCSVKLLYMCRILFSGYVVIC